MVSPSENTVYLQGSRKHALDIENGLGRSFFQRRVLSVTRFGAVLSTVPVRRKP